jgi:5'-3' exonuclease
MNNILLIDGDYLPYVVLHRKVLVDEQGEKLKDELGNYIREDKTIEESYKQCDDILHNIFNNTLAIGYIIFLTTNFKSKKEIYPDYKANRDNIKKPEGYYDIVNYLESHYNAFKLHGYEADDLILSFEKMLKYHRLESGDIINIIKCSHDKDLLQCSGRNYNIKKFEFVEKNDWQAEEDFMKDLCIGQPSDNIKGIKGFGPKAWSILLNKYFASECSFSLISHCFEQYVKTYGINNGIEEFYKNYKLLKIKDDIIVEKPEKLIKFLL